MLLKMENYYYDEIHKYISGTLGSLYCVTYKPLTTTKRGYIIIHPYGEEKKSSHRFLVELSRMLASAGFNVMQFDLFGFGDSHGKSKGFSINSWLKDLEIIYQYFRQETGISEIGVIGLRFGSYVGLLSALRCESNVKSLVLIEPVFDAIKFFKRTLTDKYIKELIIHGNIINNDKKIFKDLTENGSIDINGYTFTQSFYQELKDYQSKIIFDQLCTDEIFIFKISLTGKLSHDILDFIKKVNIGNRSVFSHGFKFLSFWQMIEPVSFVKINQQIVKRLCFSSAYDV
jgi:alpha/beta superfamily hydrolase